MTLAFEVTMENIQNTLPEKQFSDDTLAFLLTQIDLDKVNKVALLTDNESMRTLFAEKEIKRQLDSFFHRFPEEISIGFSQDKEAILYIDSSMDKFTFDDFMEDIETTGFTLDKDLPVEFIVLDQKDYGEFEEEVLFEGQINLRDNTLSVNFNDTSIA